MQHIMEIIRMNLNDPLKPVLIYIVKMRFEGVKFKNQ